MGLFRPVVVWPFPERRFRDRIQGVKAVVVVELNYGQVVLEVERLVAGQAKTILVPHGGGALHDPEQVLEVVEEVLSITMKIQL